MNKIGVQWIVESVAQSVNFYSTKLGFKITWVGEGPFFAMLNRGNFTVMLRELKQEIWLDQIGFRL